MARRWAPLLIVLSCTQALAPYLPRLTGVGVPIGGDRNGVPDPPLVPAGYAFSIWGFIFLGCFSLSFAMMSQRWRRDGAIAGMVPWLCLGMFACTMWSIVASYSDLVLGQGWWGLSIPNFVLLLWCLLRALGALARGTKRGEAVAGGEAHALVGITLGLFAGWSTAATFANIAAWAASEPMADFGLRQRSISLALLLAAGITSCILLLGLVRSWRLPLAQAAYAFAIAWALVAIAVKNQSSDVVLAGCALGISAVVIVLGLLPAKNEPLA